MLDTSGTPRPVPDIDCCLAIPEKAVRSGGRAYREAARGHPAILEEACPCRHHYQVVVTASVTARYVSEPLFNSRDAGGVTGNRALSHTKYLNRLALAEIAPDPALRQIGLSVHEARARACKRFGISYYCQGVFFAACCKVRHKSERAH